MPSKLTVIRAVNLSNRLETRQNTSRMIDSLADEHIHPTSMVNVFESLVYALIIATSYPHIPRLLEYNYRVSNIYPHPTHLHRG